MLFKVSGVVMCNMQVVKQDYNVKRGKQETVVVMNMCTVCSPVMKFTD